MKHLVDGIRGELALYCMKRANVHSDRFVERRGSKTWRREVKATFGWLKAAMFFMDKTGKQYIRDAFAEEVKRYQ